MRLRGCCAEGVATTGQIDIDIECYPLRTGPPSTSRPTVVVNVRCQKFRSNVVADRSGYNQHTAEGSGDVQCESLNLQTSELFFRLSMSAKGR